MEFRTLVEIAGRSMEAAGIAVIVIGAVAATIKYLNTGKARRLGPTQAYTRYRTEVAMAILLGLEFLVAGDIINTVVIDPSFASVGVLAAIVAIRTFLSFELTLEIEGRWPWQPPRQPDPDPDQAPVQAS